MELTIVVPCYNESRRLELAAFSRFLAETRATRLLFVDDGSTDETATLLHEFCSAHLKRANVLALERNCGKAEAVRRGMLSASATDVECVGFWDADLATPLEAALEFRDVLERQQQVQIVWGTRLGLLGHQITRQPIRRLLGKIFSACSALAVGLPIHDALCGAKLFRNTSLLRDIFGSPFDSRWIFDVEILARVRSLVESESIPSILFEQPLAQWREVGDSRLRGRDFVRAGSELSGVFWRTRLSRHEWKPVRTLPDPAELRKAA